MIRIENVTLQKQGYRVLFAWRVGMYKIQVLKRVDLGDGGAEQDVRRASVSHIEGLRFGCGTSATFAG